MIETGDDVRAFETERCETEVFTGEVVGWTDGYNRVAVVLGPAGPGDPSGFREVPRERLEPLDD